MKLLPIALVSLACGAVVGTVLAYVRVGQVETRLVPPPLPGQQAATQAAAGTSVPAPSKPSGPAVEVDSDKYDFGTMQRGATQSHQFQFKNVGDQPLTLVVGRTSCKCTLGDVSGEPLQPGQSAPVRLEWVAKSLPGEFRQAATIQTNDPRRPSVELTIVGMVTELAGLSPNELLLGKFSPDSVATASVVLSSYAEDSDSDPLVATASAGKSEVLKDKCRIEVVSLAKEEIPDPKATSALRIELTAGPGMPIGSLTEWVEVQTNLHDGRPRGTKADGSVLQLPVLGLVEGDVTLHGPNWSKRSGILNLGKIRSSQGKEVKLRLSFKGANSAERRATLESVDPEWLEVEMGEPIPIREGVMHQPLIVRVPPGRPPEIRAGKSADDGGIGAGLATVRLSTNHPTSQNFDFRVRFLIAE